MRTVAVVQAKGGVGKSTVSVHLACGLADAGFQTILIDLDPSCGSSKYLGIEADSTRPDLWDALEGRAELLSASQTIDGFSHLRVIPHRFSGYEAVIRGPYRLRVCLAPLRRKGIDFVILDTPPSWSPATAKALTAANEALVVAEPKTLSLVALVDQMRIIEDTRERMNPDLRLLGIVPNRVLRTRLSRQSLAGLEAKYPGRVLPAIRESAQLAEAPGSHQPVSHYAPGSSAARDFASLTEAVMRLIAPKRSV